MNFTQDVRFMRWKEASWVSFLTLFFLNFIVKYHGAAYNSIWTDEAFSYFKAILSPNDILFNSFEDLGNPPLYYIILHYWGAIFGYDTFGLRSFSLIISSLTAAFLFFIGKRLFSQKAGWFAALLFTFSTEHIYYAQEIRSYALLTFLCTVSTYYFIRFIYLKRFSAWHVLGLALLNAFLMYVNYAALFFPFAQLMVVCFLRENKKLLIAFFFSCLLSLVFYVPQIIYFIYGYQHDNLQASWWLDKPRLEHFFHFWKYYWNWLWLPALVLLVFAVYFSITKRKVPKLQVQHIRILTFFFLSTLVLNFLFSQFVIPLFLPRYLNCFTVFLFLLFGGLMSIYWRKGITPVIAFVFLMASFKMTDFAPTNGENWKAAAFFVTQYKHPNNRVFVLPEQGKLPLYFYILSDDVNRSIISYDSHHHGFFSGNTFNDFRYFDTKETIIVAASNYVSKEDRIAFVEDYQSKYIIRQLEIHAKIIVYYLKPL